MIQRPDEGRRVLRLTRPIGRKALKNVDPMSAPGQKATWSTHPHLISSGLKADMGSQDRDVG
jgi:hypothetical protein